MLAVTQKTHFNFYQVNFLKFSYKFEKANIIVTVKRKEDCFWYKIFLSVFINMCFSVVVTNNACVEINIILCGKNVK